MRQIKSIAVFCASSHGTKDNYQKTAFELGQFLAKKDIRLVYGGASVGCMGAVAQGAIEAGGEVIGVLPTFLNKREIAHLNLTQLILVDSMHERKLKMHELSDACITLPGGFGTMEEFFEMLTWAQLGLHQKPSAVLNTNGFYDHLMKQIFIMKEEGLLKDKYYEMLICSDRIEDLFTALKNYTPPAVEQWMKEDEI